MPADKRRRPGRYAVIAVFLLILFLPGLLLPLLSRITGERYDGWLNGYTPPRQDVELSAGTWLSGAFQENWSARFEDGLIPRANMVKLYNTANMLFFGKSDQIVGKGYDIIETAYVESELALTESDDFSLPENIQAMADFARDLDRLRELLVARGKTLVVYIAPSKANLYRENIPDRYLALSENHPRAVDVFRREMDQNDVPLLICADLADELEYPAFYPTGIHWSRTYEQFTSRYLIGLISRASGIDYTNIVLGEAEAGEQPFYRDDDVLNLANVFYKPGITYYQYVTAADEQEDCVPMSILIQGDSFALGFRKDLQENIPGSEVWLVTNDYSVSEPDGREILLYGQWENMDWARCLDQVDVVAIETAEPFLKHRTYGFVRALLAYLETE